MTMNKLSSDKVANILSQVPGTLRALSEENQSLKEKVAFYERRDRAEKIASEMQRKNLDASQSYEDRLQTLMAPETDLDVVEKAVEMSAHQVKLASLSDHPGNASDAEGRFVNGILGD